NYRELLLGFEPLNRPYSSVNLSEVLIEIFKKHDISNRILAIISDNILNNTTLLSLRELLRSIKADP
ncbi:unnamed protein product, partial [Penicillium nalgiovense]